MMPRDQRSLLDKWRTMADLEPEASLWANVVREVLSPFTRALGSSFNLRRTDRGGNAGYDTSDQLYVAEVEHVIDIAKRLLVQPVITFIGAHAAPAANLSRDEAVALVDNTCSVVLFHARFNGFYA